MLHIPYTHKHRETLTAFLASVGRQRPLGRLSVDPRRSDHEGLTLCFKDEHKELDGTGLTPEAAKYQYHHFRYGEGAWADLTVWLREAVATPTASVPLIAG